jgi:hypothetical protein
MSAGPKRLVQDFFRDLTHTVYRAQRIRYRLARSLLSRLQSRTSKPTVVEINGYQTYIWVPQGKEREYRLWPYTLTSKSGGWLDTRPYAPASPPIAVNWDDVYRKLTPSFSVKTAVLQSIRDLLGMLTQAEITAQFAEPTDWQGRVMFGDYLGWYRVDSRGIAVRYFDAALDRWSEGYVARSEVSGCDAKDRLSKALSDVAAGIEVKCSGAAAVRTNYEAPLCSDLDQLVTYIRQLMERQAYCVYVYPERIFFFDGPLQGLSWTYTTPASVVFYAPGRGAILVDVDRLLSDLQTAVSNCAYKMRPVACAQTGAAP